MDVQVSMPPPPPPPPPPAFFTETTTVVPPPPQPVTTTTTATTTVSVASPPTQDRIWLHPWTVNEMREHASQWSLAGDAGVLLYLEQFSDRLTQRADAIHQHLNQTVDAVKSTHTRVLNCLNEFTSLANTQFIENRVYDEDETANTTTTGSKKDEQSTDKTNVNNTEAQEKVLQRYVEAIQYGLAILDTHFERVEPKLDNNQNGGSSFVDDDEDGGIPLEPILEPKDPYISRPLPHLIGTPEFMQDDYVGLGDLLTLLDEDGYEVEQIAKVDSDSALSSSEEEEEEEPGEQDFQAQISPAPLVPAGASRPVNRPPPTLLTDSGDDDDDDPFGINKNISKINNISSKQPTDDDNLFDDEPKPSKKVDFAPPDSDKEDNLFENPTKKPQSITVDKNDSSDDESLASSKESDEPEVPKKIVKSELQKAVDRRRKAMGDPVSSSGDDDDDELVKKPTKPSNETISSLVTKPKPKSSSEVPSSSAISNLTSQPLTKPKSSIFGEHDDDDDLFSDAPKLATTISSSTTTTTKIDTKLSLKIPPKKEKDMFDEDSDEYDDPFSSKKSPSTITKKNEPIPKVQPTIINKPKPIIHSDDSEEDTIFGTKSTPIVIEKNKPPSSDDELFPTSTITKLQPQTSTKSTKLSDDEEPLFIDKSPVKPVISSPAPAPVVVPSVPKPKPTVNEDSDDEILGISKKPPQPSTTGSQKVIAPTKPDDDDDDDLFDKPSTTSNLSKTEISKVIPSVNSDEDDILFPPKPTQLKLPPPVNLPPLPSPPSTKPDVYKDPLGIQTPVQPTPQSPPIKTSSVPVKQKLPDDDSDEDSTAKPSLNPLALEGNQKRSVKDMALGLKIPTGAHKPGVRRKASSITEEPPKPSADDDQPIQNIEPPPTSVKKITKLALDSDDDDDELFSNKKKTPTTPIVEPKDKTNIENETGKNKIKDLSSRITIKPMMPGARPPPISNESNNTTHTTSNEASKEEPIVDKAMLNILKDRAKGPIRTRAAPTRKTRPTGAAAAAISTDENDDLFASPKSTNTIPSSPPASAAVPVTPPPASAAVPVIPPPVSAAVPVIPPPSITVPPPVPVTGLLDKPAAIAAISDKQTNSKEKKKFSLFDSDDSDIDELLFGFSKKTKSPVVSKPTATPKATTKSSILPLDDDNDDFLAKRPIKKNTKPVDNDDIFADVKGKDPQINKAKKDWSIMSKSATGETDDIFNDTATKTSTTEKPKATATKNKSTKNFDDLFDDPLKISSKS